MDRDTIRRSLAPVEKAIAGFETLSARDSGLAYAEYRSEVARCWQALILLRPDALGYLHTAEQAHWSEAVAAKKLAMQRRDARRQELAAMHFAMAQGLQDLGRRLARRINPFSEKESGTFERQQHAAEADPVMALFLDGKLDAGHVAAARNIQWVYEAVTAGTSGKGGMDIGGGRAPQGSGRKGGDMGFAVALEHANVYLPWVDLMQRRRAPLEAILDLVARGCAIGRCWRRAVLESGQGTLRKNRDGGHTIMSEPMTPAGFVEALQAALEAFDEISHGRRQVERVRSGN